MCSFSRAERDSDRFYLASLLVIFALYPPPSETPLKSFYPYPLLK